MEKKGDLLNQLAIISDLLERANIKSESTTIVVGLSDIEFEKTFYLVEKKHNGKTDKPRDTFKITIGEVDLIFNKNNV